MNYTIGMPTIVAIGADMIIGLAIPLFLFFVLRKKSHCSGKAFMEGTLTALLVTFLMKQVLHGVVLSTGAGVFIRERFWLYGLYAGLVSGILEESARVFVFRKRLPMLRGNDRNALMFGAGHGGIMAAYLLTVCMYGTLQNAILIYNGQVDMMYGAIEDQVAKDAIMHMLDVLCTTPPVTYLMMAVEQAAAVLMHMSLSVIIWFAINKEKKPRWILYLIAVGTHVVIETAAAVVGNYANIVVTEIVIWIFTLAIFWVSRQVWHQNHDEAQDVL